jgi:transposase
VGRRFKTTHPFHPDGAQKRLPVRTIKRVLDLHARGLGEREIARSRGIAQSTVSDYLTAASAANVTWPEAGEWDEAEMERKLYPHKPAPESWRNHDEPEWLKLQQDLQQNKDLTLQLAWEEYRAQHDGGYSYSRFCELDRSWPKKLDVVLRQAHRAGEKMFVDYAGAHHSDL